MSETRTAHPQNFAGSSTFSRITHAAVIMDGNGRWALERGLPRGRGHREGAKAVRRCVEAAIDLDLPILTLYAFSSDNWNRPESEVTLLLDLFAKFLRDETSECLRERVRLEVIGRRDRLPASLLTDIERTEASTRNGDRLRLRLAIDYSSRDSILRAAELASGSSLDRDRFRSLLAAATHQPAVCPDVDLLIRTGREKRLSDFLLWESAYAELVFLDKLWPDFDAEDLALAIRSFESRDRRFGALPSSSQSAKVGA